MTTNPAFEHQEYEQRLHKTRKAMQDKGIELLLVSDPSNMAWLTGYDGWSFYVHQGVLLSLDGPPALVRPWSGRQWRQAHLFYGRLKAA